MAAGHVKSRRRGVEFIAGHVLVQEQLDPDPERDLAPWIGLIGGHVGRAAGVVAERPTDPDAGARPPWAGGVRRR